MQKLVISFLFFTLSFSQNYSLNFDGESDYVEVTNESAMIANADQMTLSGWVYPRGPNADSYTQFDGFLVLGIMKMLIFICYSSVITK